MNSERIFVIRRTFLLPLGLLLLLCLALFVLCLAMGEPRGKVIILGLIIVPVLALFIESAWRQTIVAGEEITVRKLLRRRVLRLPEVTSVDTVLVRRRAFLTLSAGDEFVILSNAYANFPDLVRAILARVPAATISDDTRRMASAPPSKSTDIVSCWLAVALVALILYVQSGGHF